jgi:hypothetical protein
MLNNLNDVNDIKDVNDTNEMYDRQNLVYMPVYGAVFVFAGIEFFNYMPRLLFGSDIDVSEFR